MKIECPANPSKFFAVSENILCTVELDKEIKRNIGSRPTTIRLYPEKVGRYCLMQVALQKSNYEPAFDFTEDTAVFEDVPDVAKMKVLMFLCPTIRREQV